MTRTVMILGGYGNFGRRIVEALAHEPGCRVLVCGRDPRQAKQIAEHAGGSAEPLALDCHAGDFAANLSRLGVNLVIHTAGPFQGQSYYVPRACIAARSHYIDLADGREFVCGIAELDEQAKSNDVLVVSGASTLPALSSAVVDRLRRSFSAIDVIDCGISAAAKPPGEATMRGVFAYAGKPIRVWREGGWSVAHGWQGLARRRYPSPAGSRWLAHCDVPDLELFPQCYQARTVEFRAGVESKPRMWGLSLAAWTVRAGVLSSLVPWVPALRNIAVRLERYGSKCSAMHVSLHGRDLANNPLSRTWCLVAKQDHGPYIPTFPSIALARKILRGEVPQRGAMPCMGLLSVDEILAPGSHLELKFFGGDR